MKTITKENVKVGDRLMTEAIFTFNGRKWSHIYTILAVKPTLESRFGRPDRIVHVEIKTTDGYVVEQSIKRWFSQLV